MTLRQPARTRAKSRFAGSCSQSNCTSISPPQGAMQAARKTTRRSRFGSRFVPEELRQHSPRLRGGHGERPQTHPSSGIIHSKVVRRPLPGRLISTNVTVETEPPDLFAPHPNFSDTVNRNLAQSEIEGGVHLK